MPALPIPSFNFIFFSLVLLMLLPESILSLSFNKSPTQFDRDVILLGDAAFTNDFTSVQLTNPEKSSPSSGVLIQRKPFKFLNPISKNHLFSPVSFSLDFSFSISSHEGDGLALIIVPADFASKFSPESSFGLPPKSRFFGVEFDTLINGNVGDQNSNHIGIDVGSLVSVKTSNVSLINLVLNSGVKLHSWVDYDSSSKRLEVRLAEFGSARPYNPLLVYQIDLAKMWEEEVLIGLSSSSGNSTQRCTIHSFEFGVRSIPKWLHSHPLDPRLSNEEHSEEKVGKKTGVCFLGFLSGLIFGTGCGALVAFIALLLWTIFADSSREEVIPAQSLKLPGGFRYEKINVVVADSSDNLKN